MINTWFIKGDFKQARSGRIGASDIPALFPDPERPTQSLAGYGRTAVTVYQEKIGELEREPAGFPAEMGHYLENKTLEIFIRNIEGFERGQKFRFLKESFESKKNAKAENYQLVPWFHSVQYFNDGIIVHPDMVYKPEEQYVPNMKNKPDYVTVMKDGIVKVNGIAIDLSEPFIVEAKSARGYATKRPPGSYVHGYDFSLQSGHGIPLKHYFQIQFQLALLQVKTAYLALTYDTSNYAFWKIPADRKTQGRIMDVVGKMVKHIKDRTMPKELAICNADVHEMYPVIEQDYCMVIGKEADKIREICEKRNNAKRQQDNWKGIEQDCKDAVAVYLKNYKEIRDSSGVLIAWKKGRSADGLSMPVADIRKNMPKHYNYLIKHGLIREGKDYRYVDFRWKGEE